MVNIIEYVHPTNGRTLLRDARGYIEPVSGDIFEIIGGIPRFCTPSNYSDSFGFQWNLFEKTQIDIYADSTQSRDRFYQETGWNPDDLCKYSVLEVGCGAGRFSEVFLRTTSGVLHSVDYSNAVEANKRNNYKYEERLRISQASIYELPFSSNSFDRVFCLGVLQHTPSLKESVASLVNVTKPGGQIVVDFYTLKGWYTKIHSKYILRPITKRLPKLLLINLIRLNIHWMIGLFDLLCLLHLGFLTRFIPIADIRGFPKELTDSQRIEWGIMDTFDCFAPKYDTPHRISDVANIFTELGCNIIFAGVIDLPNGAASVVRVEKRLS